jgi:RNA polymerase sigma factor (sigma-70 family)
MESPPTLIDADLRDRALAGDEDARTRMLDDLKRGAHYFLQVRQVPLFLRDDALQEMLLRAFRAMPRWDPQQGSWRTFSNGQMLGALLDFLRESSPKGFRRAMEFPDILSLDARTASNQSRKDDLADPKNAEVDFDDLVEVLLAGTKREQAIAWYFLCGLSMKATGERLGVSESRVSQLISDYLEDPWAKERLLSLMGAA